MINLLFATDKKYIQHLTVTLQSIFENNKNTSFKVFLLVEEEPDQKFGKVVETLSRVGVEHSFLKIDLKKFSQFEVDRHVTLASYFRLILGDVLPPEINKIIYFDSDLVVCSDIGDLWGINVKGYALAAVEDSKFNRHSDLKIPLSASYFNAGVLVINVDFFRRTSFFKSATSYYLSNQEKILWWDQDILNGLLFNNWYKLENAWNVTTTEVDSYVKKSSSISPKIIHYTGSSKPWHFQNKHPLKQEYYYYLHKTPFKNFSPFIEYLKNKVEYLLKGRSSFLK